MYNYFYKKKTMETVEGTVIDEIEINTDKSPKSTKKCSSCGKFRKQQWFLIAISFYILFAAIYGTIKLIHEVQNYFTN